MKIAPVDVSRRDLGRDHVAARRAGGGPRRSGTVAFPRACPARCPVADATTWPWVVSPSMRTYRGGLLHQPIGLAGHHEGVFGQPDVEGLARAAAAPGRAGPGSPAVDAAIATEPSKRATVPRKASSMVDPSASRRETMVGITLASVVISGGSEQALGVPQIGVVVDVAVEGGDDVGRVGADRPRRS